MLAAYGVPMISDEGKFGSTYIKLDGIICAFAFPASWVEANKRDGFMTAANYQSGDGLVFNVGAPQKAKAIGDVSALSIVKESIPSGGVAKVNRNAKTTACVFLRIIPAPCQGNKELAYPTEPKQGTCLSIRVWSFLTPITPSWPLQNADSTRDICNKGRGGLHIPYGQVQHGHEIRLRRGENFIYSGNRETAKALHSSGDYFERPTQQDGRRLECHSGIISSWRRPRGRGFSRLINCQPLFSTMKFVHAISASYIDSKHVSAGIRNECVPSLLM